MMKKNIAFLCLLLFSFLAKAQIYSYTSWESNEVNYNALIIENGNKAVARVAYTTNGDSKLVEYQITISENEDKGILIFDGSDAHFVRGNGNGKYHADNFYYFYEDSPSYQPGGINVMVIDDKDIADEENRVKHFKEVRFWNELSAEDFDPIFLARFFNEDEIPYNILLNLYKDVTKTSFDIAKETLSKLEHSKINEIGNDVVFAFTKNLSGYTIAKTSTTFPSEWITEQFENSFSIAQTAYINNQWYVVLKKSNDDFKQIYKISDHLPETWIKENWKNNFRISTTNYCNGKWVIVMRKPKNLTYTKQAYNNNENFPLDWIQSKRDAGLKIMDISYGNGEWLVTMNERVEGYDTQIYVSTSFPEDWIMHENKSERIITSLAYGDGKWIVITRKILGFVNQEIKISNTIPEAMIAEMFHKKYYISQIRIGKK